MKIRSVPFLALLHMGARVLAQNCVATALSAIPRCAQNCILNGAPAIGCGGTDFACQCQQTAGLFAAVEVCVQSSCPSDSFQGVIDGASTVCDCAGPGPTPGGTYSVSGISTWTVPPSVSVTATRPIPTPSVGTGVTYSPYPTGSSIATASVVGAAAQAAPSSNVMRYAIPIAIVGAAII
ncbi:unnamed protein product [Discula destructiva]